jgi:hypothetical protein
MDTNPFSSERRMPPFEREAGYQRLCISQPTNRIGVAMMKLPSVRTEPQNM